MDAKTEDYQQNQKLPMQHIMDNWIVLCLLQQLMQQSLAGRDVMLKVCETKALVLMKFTPSDTYNYPK